MSIIAASWAAVRPGPMSELGQKRKCRSFHVISALPHKADIDRRDRDVRFVPLPDSFQSYLKKELLPL
jgi:hypothetical protein